MSNIAVLLFVQVHLSTEADEYSKAPGDTFGEKVNKNLFFDLAHSHLYITTERKVCFSGFVLMCHVHAGNTRDRGYCLLYDGAQNSLQCNMLPFFSF